MKKAVLMAKILTLSCSVLAGAVISLLFIQDLSYVDFRNQSGAFGGYAVLFSDMAVSLMAGGLSGWLIHFCIWECLGSWLSNLWLHLKNRLQSRDGGAEQTG